MNGSQIQTNFIFAMIKKNHGFKQLSFDRQGEICIAISNWHDENASLISKKTIMKVYKNIMQKGE